ncbi:glycosyltransferase [Desulfobaculum sp.]
MKGAVCIVTPYARPEVNPTLVNLAEALAARFYRVDILSPDGDMRVSLPDGLTGIVAEHGPCNPMAPSPGGLRGRLVRRLRRTRRPRQLCASDYKAIIGVDPRGLEMAHRLNTHARLPLVYLSFEIMFDDELTPAERPLRRAERAACRNVQLTLVQDAGRAILLAEQTGLPREDMVLVPNAPLRTPLRETRWLRSRLGIPDERRIVLYAGSPSSWAGLHLWQDMLATWPEEFLLVVHCRSGLGPRMDAHLGRLTESGRLLLSHGPVPPEVLPQVFASADFGFAPYMATPDDWTSGKNITHIGFSSGKVGWYALCGLPILASALPVFTREFTRYGCGRIYEQACETGRLLTEMDRDYAFHSQESQRFYDERLDPAPGLAAFCDRLEALLAQEAA